MYYDEGCGSRPTKRVFKYRIRFVEWVYEQLFLVIVRGKGKADAYVRGCIIVVQCLHIFCYMYACDDAK